MKVTELLKMGCEMLKLMSEHDVRRDDYKYVGMVEEYNTMRCNAVKHSAAISMLAEDYAVSTRTVERIIRRLKREIVK